MTSSVFKMKQEKIQERTKISDKPPKIVSCRVLSDNRYISNLFLRSMLTQTNSAFNSSTLNDA